jgi:hypothetical protein
MSDAERIAELEARLALVKADRQALIDRFSLDPRKPEPVGMRDARARIDELEARLRRRWRLLKKAESMSVRFKKYWAGIRATKERKGHG